MNVIPRIATSRLLLREWRDADREAFACMNADPRVMEFMSKALTHAESEATVRRMQEHWTAHGLGNWAVEIAASGVFIGFVGLSVPRIETAFTPCVEVGWRLAFEHWGRGFATEAARAALAYGFGECALPEIVSFTAAKNERSRRVMERLGMHRDPADDFDHPALPEGHPLRKHVLYRISHDDELAA